MKKKLLMIILTIAILTSLTAGTLAIYTKSITETETIEAKRFAFSASGEIVGNSEVINLAPTESMEYVFTIANSEEKNGPVAEVPLKFDVTIDIKDASKKMPGLIATLYPSKGNKVLAESANGIIQFSNYSKADNRYEESYRLVITWEDDGQSNTVHTTAGSDKTTLDNGFTLTVVATQATSVPEE